MKNLAEYISPSRINCFINSKREFIQNYIFKNRRPDTAAFARARETHEFLYGYFNQPEGFVPVVIPDFGPVRKTDACSSEEAKKNREKKAQFELENEGKTIFTRDEYGIWLALNSFLLNEPDLKKALKISVENNRQGTEVVLHCDKPFKLQCRVDSLLPNGVVDTKTTRKSEFLEPRKADEFFKYEEKQKCIQAVVNEICFIQNFGEPKKGFKFLWFIFCNTFPYGVKAVGFDRSYLDGVKKLLLHPTNGYLVKYNEFMEEVKQILGYNPLIIKEYKGDPVRDWAKFNKLIGCQGIEYAAPSWWAMSKQETDLGEMG